MSAESEPRPSTLGRVVENLGAGIVDVLAAPAGVDVQVAHAVIHDPGAPLEVEAGDLVLAVGIAPEDRAAAALLTGAGNAGAAAVAIRTSDGDHSALVDAADRAGVALLGVHPRVTWAQLYSLIRTAMASTGDAPESVSVGGVGIGDLFALANAVAAMVGGPVTIEDPKSQVLAYSSLDEPVDEPRLQTILGRRVPEEWVKRLQEAGLFKRLWRSDDVIEVRDLPGGEELRPRLAIAVKAGGEILGSIWAAEGTRPFTEEAHVAMRHAAEIAALHLVRARVGDDLEQRARSELVRGVLDGRGSLRMLAERLGLDAGGRFAVAAIELQTDEEHAGLQRERVAALVATYCKTLHRRAAQMAQGRTIYVLAPLAADEGLDGVIRLAHEIVEQPPRSLSVELRAGIGSVVDHLREAPRSRTEADHVLRLLAGRSNAPPVATIDDVRAQAILLELRDVADQLSQLRHGRLRLLVNHDRDNGTDYVETLRAYLDWFGRVPDAADAIGVHANTFRYRIRRLGEITGINVEDPDERLALELQLRLLGD